MNRKFYLALGMLLVGGLLIFLWNFSRPSTPAGAGASTTGFSSVSQKKTTLSRFFASSGVSSSAQDHALTEKPTAWAQAKLAASNSSAPSSSAKAQTASDPRGLPYADSFPREVLPSGTPMEAVATVNGKSFYLRPNESGSTNRVYIPENGKVNLSVAYPDLDRNSKIFLTALDGGVLSNGKKTDQVLVGEHGEINFSLQAETFPGLYRIEMRYRNDFKVVDLWVGTPNPLAMAKKN